MNTNTLPSPQHTPRRPGFMLVAALATSALLLAGCQNKTQEGALTGATIGAIGGAIIGHQSGRGGEGAGIGAAAGALIGGGIGNAQDESNRQRRYDY